MRIRRRAYSGVSSIFFCPDPKTAIAVVVGDRAYLVDFGPGVMRQASKAYFAGIDAILKEIREAGYDGPVVNGHDLDVF